MFIIKSNWNTKNSILSELLILISTSKYSSMKLINKNTKRYMKN